MGSDRSSFKKRLNYRENDGWIEKEGRPIDFQTRITLHEKSLAIKMWLNSNWRENVSRLRVKSLRSIPKVQTPSKFSFSYWIEDLCWCGFTCLCATALSFSFPKQGYQNFFQKGLQKRLLSLLRKNYNMRRRPRPNFLSKEVWLPCWGLLDGNVDSIFTCFFLFCYPKEIADEFYVQGE